MPKTAEIRGYQGPDRRRRTMYVTRNTEYHFDQGVCIAVRDRQTQSFLLTHPVLRRSVSGSVRFTKRFEARPSLARPELGESLLFVEGGPEVVTSNLLSVERPEKTTVTAYPD